MVASVASRRSTISSVPIQPKSRAVTVASRYMPDVGRRGAMRDDRLGVVLEVVGRQAVVLGADEGLEEPPGPAGGQAEGLDVGGRELLGGRVGRWQADPPGDQGREQPQARRTASAIQAAAGLQHQDEHRGWQPRSRRRPPSAGRSPPRSRSWLALAWAAVIHSSRFRRVTISRASVRTIASTISHAWCARNVKRERHLGRGEGDIGCRRLRRWLRLEMPWRRGSRPARTGSAAGTTTEAQHERGPQAGGDRGQRPGRDERRQRERGGQRPAQVVDHLPAGDAGIGAPAPTARGVAGTPEDPRQELPVAPRPAVLAGRRDQVVRRELLEQLDVGHQPGPGEDALEQVVAQERVLRHAVRHRHVEGVEVVDPLAGVAPLAEQVLVHVGDREGVRVDPRRPGVDPLEERRLVLLRQRRRDPRLEHAVAVGHAAGLRGRSVGRLSGWAIVPTRRATAPRGSRVSASSVTT